MNQEGLALIKRGLGGLWGRRAPEKPTLVGDERLKSILPKEKAVELKIIPLEYDLQKGVLKIATTEENVGEVKRLIETYARNQTFARNVAGYDAKIQTRVFGYSTEEMNEALRRYYGGVTRAKLDVNPEVFRLVDDETCWNYKILLRQIIGTKMIFVAEDGPGRAVVRELFKNEEFRRKVSIKQRGDESLLNDLSFEVEVVQPGTVHANLQRLLGEDRETKKKIKENIEAIREQTQKTTVKADPVKEKGAIEELLQNTLVGLVEQKYSDLMIAYDFDAGEVLFSARQMGRYEVIERHRIAPADYQRIVTWLLRQMNVTGTLTSPWNGPLTLKNVLFKKENKYKNILIRASYLPLIDPAHREAECNGRFSLRILNDEGAFFEIEELGYLPNELDLLRRVIECKSGLILIVGEMGHGKSATANALLARKAQMEKGKDFISIEKPVEYKNPYLSQVEIRDQEGVSVLSYLATLVRQGTNGVFLGEVGEGDMARMLVTMSLTGVYVVSTFHAINPFAAVQRLTANPFNLHAEDLSATIAAVIHQKLVRRLCPTCARPDENWRAKINARADGGELLHRFERHLRAAGVYSDPQQLVADYYVNLGRQIWQNMSEEDRQAYLLENNPKDEAEWLRIYHTLGKVMLAPEDVLRQVREMEVERGRAILFSPREADGRLPDGRPCPTCVGEGRKPGSAGRMAVPEIWIPTLEEKIAMAKNISAIEMERLAVQNGFVPLFYAGLDRVARGMVDIADFLDVIDIPPYAADAPGRGAANLNGFAPGKGPAQSPGAAAPPPTAEPNPTAAAPPNPTGDHDVIDADFLEL